MYKTNRNSSFYPDYVVNTILDIAPEKLKELNITHIAFDVDDTLVRRGDDTLSAEYLTHLQSLEKNDIKVLIGSNTPRNIENIISHLQGRIVRPTRSKFKPQRRYYAMIVEATRTTPSHVAMAGDRILNDIIGANRAGLTTILVRPFARKAGVLNRLYTNIATRKVTTTEIEKA